MSSVEERQQSPKKSSDNVDPSESPKEKAKAAMEGRAKKSSNSANYWMVVIFFAVMGIGGSFYVYKEWRSPADTVLAVDLKEIEKFNEKGYLFQRGTNSLFKVRIFQ